MQTTRRNFIFSASAIGASLALPTKSLFASSASEKVNLAIIGCGGRGQKLIDFFNEIKEAEIISLCDADMSLVEKASSKCPKATKTTDMRHIFDSPDVDAVVIATSNQWHCLAAIWAMQAGKHVYVEKPLGHSQWEGEQVINASKKYNRICQVGTQQRSDPMQAEIKNFLHEEKVLGEIESVRVNRFGVRKPIGLRKKPMVVAKQVNYDLWLGPSQDLPIYRNELNYDWHWDWNTGSGEMGNWGVHIIDDVRNNIFLDKLAAPKHITASGGRFAWNDAGNTPNVHFALLETGSIPVAVTLCNLPLTKSNIKVPGPTSGYIAYCENGRLEGQRRSAKAFDADGNLIKQFKGEEGVLHQQNFIDAIRQDNPDILMAPVQVGHDSTTWCNFINIATKVGQAGIPQNSKLPAIPIGNETPDSLLGNLSNIIAINSKKSSEAQLELGPTLKCETKQAKFIGAYSKQANAFLRRVDRKGFEVPNISIA